MPRVTDVAILRQNEQHTLFVRTKTRVEELPALIGRSYGAMAAYLGEMGEYLADIPYVGYHNMDMQDLDVEIGFPVSRALPGKGDIQSGSIPAGKIAFCIYRGPYAEVEATYEEMIKWIRDNGHTFVGPSYEYYYNGPGFPESELLTRIVMTIK